MNLSELLESEHNRLNIVKKEILEDAGVSQYLEMQNIGHRKYILRYEKVSKQQLKIESLIEKNNQLIKEFNKYNENKEND